ncbi:MAG: hypothetical protein J6Q81_08020, partial [Lentisphaeria bacterium]|nr:hypothetical protein [Lentisphaeria bacterium]
MKNQKHRVNFNAVFFLFCKGNKTMKKWSFSAVAALVVFLGGGCCSTAANTNVQTKFTRVFLWGTLRSEAETARY